MIHEFFNAYVECALWSEPAFLGIAHDGTITEDPGNDQSFDAHNFGQDDIHPDSLAAMRADCAAFVADNSADLNGLDPAQSGHDFWLTRNHHGAGFWDRGYGPKGDRLTDAAHAYGETALVFSQGAIHCQ